MSLTEKVIHRQKQSGILAHPVDYSFIIIRHVPVVPFAVMAKS